MTNNPMLEKLDKRISEVLNSGVTDAQISRLICNFVNAEMEALTKNKYTVFGFYTDSGLKYASDIEAESVEEAIQMTAGLYPDESLSIVAVVAGTQQDLMEGEYIEDTDDMEKP